MHYCIETFMIRTQIESVQIKVQVLKLLESVSQIFDAIRCELVCRKLSLSYLFTLCRVYIGNDD